MLEGDSHLMGPLAAFAADTHSQFGEDGIIAEALRRIGAGETGARSQRHAAAGPSGDETAPGAAGGEPPSQRHAAAGPSGDETAPGAAGGDETAPGVAGGEPPSQRRAPGAAGGDETAPGAAGGDETAPGAGGTEETAPGTQGRLDRWCVEFGAWDGRYLSNTARLVGEDGYRAVLIEADVARAAQLARAHPGGNVIAMQAKVGTQGATSLDSLLSATPVPTDFDLLSVDIDGNDYHVWQAVQEYRPKVVVVEFNPTIPNAVHWVQPDDASVQQGSSAAALVSLGKRKGYVPVAATHANLIFVAAEYAPAVLGEERPDLAELRDDTAAQTYLFVGYDGSVHTSRPITLPWLGGVEVAESRIQPLPPTLRGMDSGEAGRWARWRYRLAVAAADPAAYAQRVRQRLARFGRRG